VKKYDIIIIGAGPGGYVAAIKAAQLGAKVALIEKEALGGVCLNIGCIPTKALIQRAKIFRNIINSEKYGISLDKKSLKADWPAIVKRKDEIVKRLTGGVGMLLSRNGVEVIKGEAKVLDPNHVEVNGEILEAKNLILATGASPIVPPIPGVKEAYEAGIIVTSKELLSLENLPEKLVIIGGGVIGVEFATIFGTFGTQVTIIEKLDRILMNVDDDARNLILKILKRNNIEIITEATVTAVNESEVSYEKDGKTISVSAQKILMSVGMRPNTKAFEHLNLSTERGAIITNERLQTSIPNVYAIGDLNGKMMLAHVASHEGIVAVENIMGKNSTVDYSKMPSGIYGFPEIAMVGLTETQAQEQGYDYQVGRFPFSALGKALADGETDGFVKIIADKKYGEIIGVHIVAENAMEMISEGSITMELEGTTSEISNTVHPHPSLSEAFMEAAMAALNKPIHTL
jgi:dihydrolipoamide dehydrogenase